MANSKKEVKKAPAKNGKNASKKPTSGDSALEEAKKKFEAAQKRFQELRQKVVKNKRTVSTAEKKKETLIKKIEDTKNASSKAVEMLNKKAEELLAKAEQLEPEAEELEAQASEVDEEMEELNKKLEEAKEESKEKLKALGLTTSTRASVSSSDATTRRARNNFMYRLKTKDWTMVYDVRNRITHAKKDGIEIEFLPDNWVATLPDESKKEAEYGQGSLIEVAKLQKEVDEAGK